MKYKQNNDKRTRNKSLGIKLSEGELIRLNNICEALNTSKVKFLLESIKRYEEDLQ